MLLFRLRFSLISKAFSMLPLFVTLLFFAHEVQAIAKTTVPTTEPEPEIKGQNCVCNHVKITSDLDVTTLHPNTFLGRFYNRLVDLFSENDITMANISSTKFVCEDLHNKDTSKSFDDGKERHTLHLMMSDIRLKPCDIEKELYDSHAFVQIHPFVRNTTQGVEYTVDLDRLNATVPSYKIKTDKVKRQWLVDAKSPSSDIHLLIDDDDDDLQLDLVMFLLAGACGPTVGRNPIPGQYTKLGMYDVTHRYEQTITYSGPIICMGIILILILIWFIGLSVYKKIRQEELKEQRALRHYITSLDKKMNEEEQRLENEKLRKMMKKFLSKTGACTADAFFIITTELDSTQSETTDLSEPNSEESLTLTAEQAHHQTDHDHQVTAILAPVHRQDDAFTHPTMASPTIKTHDLPIKTPAVELQTKTPVVVESQVKTPAIELQAKKETPFHDIFTQATGTNETQQTGTPQTKPIVRTKVSVLTKTPVMLPPTTPVLPKTPALGTTKAAKTPLVLETPAITPEAKKATNKTQESPPKTDGIISHFF